MGKLWIVGVVVFALIFGGIVIGLSKQNTSKIIAKTIDNHWNGDTYLFAMENGVTVSVSFADYSSHEVGDNYTYRMTEIVD